MKEKYLKYIPKTLQEDFIDNRVIPFIGAGFSKNAITVDGTSIADWDELGRRVAEYIPNYAYTNAIDSLSLFEYEFSRAKLIELLAKELSINQLKPGKTHQAFCNLYFDTICTTNFDFLLEQTLTAKLIPFSTIITEERLPINTHEKTKLIKLHGDFNHPEKMIITEEDYDSYIDRNKVLSTYVSNLFITKTLLLIGYSFDDTDIRTLWQIINDRLGKLNMPAYVVLVDANPIEIARFERRNVKVINLPGDKTDYPDILCDFFIEIKQFIDTHMPEQIVVTTEKASEELRMPQEDSRLRFVSVPDTRLAFVKELIYSILDENNISPISLNETIMPGETIIRKIDVLISKASIAIVDISGNNANVMWELGNLMSKKKFVIMIGDGNPSEIVPFDVSEIPYLKYSISGDNTEFLEGLTRCIRQWRAYRPQTSMDEDYFRLLEMGEYDAAVIAVFRFLETTLREKDHLKNNIAVMGYLNLLNTNNEKDRSNLKNVKSYVAIRNEIIHTNEKVNKKQAEKIIADVVELCAAIKEGRVIIL